MRSGVQYANAAACIACLSASLVGFEVTNASGSPLPRAALGPTKANTVAKAIVVLFMLSPQNFT
jgi:hypothetical protein